jgi:hypothetical protein
MELWSNNQNNLFGTASRDLSATMSKPVLRE